MEFIELNENRNTFSIRGQFKHKHFDLTVYDQELNMLKGIEQRTINNARLDDPDTAYTLSFNHTDGHDGRFPLMAQMRDFWGLAKRNSQTWILTQDLGGTSTMHTDILYDEQRYLVFCSKWQPGQWWWFDGETYTGWNIGTVVDYDFSRPHASANASEYSRTLMQITERRREIFIRSRKKDGIHRIK